MTSTFDDVLEQAQPHHETVRLCLRGDLARDHAQLQARLLELRSVITSDKDELDALEKLAGDVLALEKRMIDESTEFVFAALGGPAWRKLIADHAPLEDQAEQRWNDDTFPLEAMTRSMIEPSGVTKPKLEALLAILTDGQRAALWGTCIGANEGVTGLGGSRAASDVLRILRPRSEQRSASASAAASSSAGSSAPKTRRSPSTTSKRSSPSSS